MLEKFRDLNIQYISYDSNDIKKNTLFICKGAHFKEEYLIAAIEKGAVAYVSEEKYDSDIPYLIVDDVRKAMVELTKDFYGNLWKDLLLFGITGTKGKSTTAYYMKSILDSFLKDNNAKIDRKSQQAEKGTISDKSAIISSIDTFDGVEEFESHLTTPEFLQLNKHFKNAVDAGIKYLTMEVSSQALKYDRVPGIIFDVAAFLNMGEDHISDIEHSSMEDYKNSKKLL
ncbi:MAG: Mur ligase family protein, partial [Anaerovoracaceae bacterium]